MEAIHGKIAALLSKTTANGCTEQEAQSAAAAAQRLMAKHRIDAADLADPGENLADIIEDTAWNDGKKCDTWRALLLQDVAKANGCKSFKYGSSLQILGTQSQVDMSCYLFGMLSAQVDAFAKRNAAGRGRTYANNYKLGMVYTLGERLRATTEQETAGASERAMVRIRREDQALAEYTRRKHPNLRQGSATSRRDPNAVARGRRDGHSVQMHKGLGGRTGSKGMIGQ
jgi:hypothetical protein